MTEIKFLADTLFLKSENILTHLLNDEKIEIVIDDSILHINDSFWKGFLNPVFEKYKTEDKINYMLDFKGDEQHLGNIRGMIHLLHLIYN